MSSHNSMSNKADGWFPPDNLWGMTQQMQDGVRGLVIDVHPYKESLYLCHAFCEFGYKHLFDGLIEFKKFLDKNPTEILSLFIETYVPNAELVKMFIEAGLEPYTYVHDAQRGWPTLGEMAEENTRLIVMVDRGSLEGMPPWLYREEDLTEITAWDIVSPADFTCGDVSPETLAPKLYLLNHFLLAPFTIRQQSERINFNPFLRERALQCQREKNHIPNFISPTFYSVGNLKVVVNELNGVTSE